MENIAMNNTEVKTRRPRRSKEEIAAEKAAKEAKRAEKEAKKQEKLKKLLEDTNDDRPDSPSKQKPEKRTAAKKSNGQKVKIPKKGNFNNPIDSIETNKMYIEIELLETALGTSPSDKDIFATYIASQAPDAATKTEEIAAIGESAVVEKSTTIFPRGSFITTENGMHMIDLLDNKEKSRYGIGARITKEMKESSVRLPYYYDYQIRGMFKDSCGLLSRANYGESADLKAYKKVIDGGIFVSPRRIAIEMPEYWYEYDRDGGLIEHETDPANLAILSRPLLTSGPSGTTTAIARSELIPAGSHIKFCIEYTDPNMKETIIEWLNYGTQHGLGAWRNSGRGTFIWREINSDYSPIEENEEEA